MGDLGFLLYLGVRTVFAGLGLGAGVTGPVAATLLVVGVVGGSAAWWLLLSGAVGALRERLDTRALMWVNRGSGAMILAFGVLAFAGLAGLAGQES